MNIAKWKIRAGILLVLISCGALCIAYPAILIRVVLFIISIPFAVMSYCYLEHAVEFRTKWKTATTGKRRTPPGESVAIGAVLLALALASLLYCFHGCGIWTVAGPLGVVGVVFLIMFVGPRIS